MGGGGKGGGGSSGPKPLRLTSDRALNTIKSSGTIQYGSTSRPVGVAFHNGRVFYFGLDIFGQPAIYFSQLMTDIDNAGKCYQDADPTAEEINDLVATDGGVLNPVGVGTPIALIEAPSGVMAFASNGVWVVKGPEGSGFSATAFNVGKITDKPCLGKQSIVEVEGAVLYFSDSGLVQLAPDEFGRIKATDITNDSIKSIYTSFTKLDRAHAKGVYIDSEKRAYWTLPRITSAGGNKNDARYILVLSTELPGFYQWSITDPGNGAALLLPLESRSYAFTEGQEALYTVGGDEVITTVAGSPIVSPQRRLAEGDPLPMFLGGYKEGSDYPVKVYHPTSPLFMDFGSVDYTSFVEFGYQYSTSKASGLAAPYIHSFFKSRRYLPTAAYIPVDEEFSESLWRYFVEDDSLPGIPSTRAAVDFDDSSWSEGIGGFGFLDDGGLEVNTTIAPKIGRAIWLRKLITIPASAEVQAIELDVYKDDYATLWWNGEEIPVSNAPGERVAPLITIPKDKILVSNVITLQVVDSVPYGTPVNILAGVTFRHIY